MYEAGIAATVSCTGPATPCYPFSPNKQPLSSLEQGAAYRYRQLCYVRPAIQLPSPKLGTVARFFSACKGRCSRRHRLLCPVTSGIIAVASPLRKGGVLPTRHRTRPTEGIRCPCCDPYTGIRHRVRKVTRVSNSSCEQPHHLARTRCLAGAPAPPHGKKTADSFPVA